MPGYSKKHMARLLRDAGHEAAALTLLLDSTDVPVVEDDDGGGGAASASASTEPPVLTRAELDACTIEQIQKLRDTPEGAKLLSDSLTALAVAEGKV